MERKGQVSSMTYKIWSKQEAKRWQEGYPLGNGRMGAMIYGGVEKEIIDLSELTFFSGEPSEDNNQPKASLAFSRMRRLAEEEKFKEASEAAREFIGVRKNYGTNLPVGKLLIDFTGQGEAHDYCRSLDLETATFEVSYIQNHTKICRRAFLSHPNQVLCYEIMAEGEGRIEGRACFDADGNPSYVQCGKGGYDFFVQAREHIHSDGTNGVSLKGKIKAFAEEGEVRYEKEGIFLRGCKRVVFAVYTETDFCQNYKIKELDVLQEFAAILKRHQQDVAQKMNRVQFSLEDTKAHLPTDQRVKLLQEGEEDNGISALQFQFGRYLLLASSREDSPLPAHLQGVWNDSVACRIGWTCDMHLDINTQMNYWLSEPANLAECHKPLFRWMEEILIPSGRISAKKSYGLSGWSADLVSNAWGYSAPYWSGTIAPCPTGGIWQASDYIEHYRYTKDKDFLRQHAYPVIREAVEFFIDYVFENEAGQFSSGPSISPENAFIKDGETWHVSNGATYEITMIRELFLQFMEVCTELGIEEELLKRVTEYEKRLLPYRIKEDGTLAEWQHDYPAADQWHRHTSHLLGLFPYAQITTEQTPNLAEAAKNSISKKLAPAENWEDTGWARSMLLLYAARLLERAKAHAHIKSMQQTLTHPNLLVMHPPTRGAGSFMEVYELDGNTGYAMGVLELLMQSHNGVIRLLPCLPTDWKEGRISGIVARGGVTISMCWKDAVLTSAELCSKEGGTYHIAYAPGDGELITKRIELKAEMKLRLGKDLEEHDSYISDNNA